MSYLHACIKVCNDVTGLSCKDRAVSCHKGYECDSGMKLHYVLFCFVFDSTIIWLLYVLLSDTRVYTLYNTPACMVTESAYSQLQLSVH